MNHIPDVEHLLALHDIAFIEGVYGSLLGRAPDPGGLDYYLARLRSGIGKEEIIVHIASSEEARRRNAQLPGLDEVLAGAQRPRGWLRRWLLPDDTHSRRKISRLENALGNVAQRFEAMEQKIDQLQVAAPAPGAMPGNPAAGHWPTSIPANQSPLEAASPNWPEKRS